MLKQCKKEIGQFPYEVRVEFSDMAAQLEHGVSLPFPHSRPMPRIGKSVHELRLKDSSGIYRVIYVVIAKEEIWMLHAFQKKTQKTPLQNIFLAQRRLKEIV